MNIADRAHVRFYLFTHSRKVRALTLLVVATFAGSWFADRGGVLPDAYPFVIAAIAVVAGLTLLAGFAWATPPGDKQGINSAIAIRNGALGLAAILIAGMAAFVGGMGELRLDVLAPAIAVTAEFLVLAGLAIRAAWYGHRPEARKALIERRAVAEAERRAFATTRVEQRRADRVPIEDQVLVVEADPDTTPTQEIPAVLAPAGGPVDEFDEDDDEEPDVVEPAPKPARRADDELSLVDLTGGDDYEWPGLDHAESADQQGNRI